MDNKKAKIGISGQFLAKPISGCGQYLTELLSCPEFSNAIIFENTRRSKRPLQKNIQLKTTYPRHDQAQQYFYEQSVGKKATNICQTLWSPYHSTTITTIPHIMTIHDAIGYMPQWNNNDLITSTLYKRAAKRAATQATHIVTVSNHAKQQIVHYLRIQPKNITVAPLGINRNTYHPHSDEEIQTAKKLHGLPAKYYAYVGGFEKRKNIELLLDISDELKHPIVIIGNIPKSIAFKIKHGTDAQKVINLKNINNKAKATLLSGAELFLWPSLEEGFGLPPLEAMACGTPVIAHKVSSMPEILGDAALWCKIDKDSWIHMIHNAESQKQQYKQKGLKRAKQYPWSKTAATIAETIKQYS